MDSVKVSPQKLSWNNLLKRDLIRFPPNGKEYHTPDNLIITITVKKKVKKRYYTFGGPHWSASLYFSKKGEIYLNYFSPLKKPQDIKYKEIIGLTVYYLS